jgi:hypothetical protein
MINLKTKKYFKKRKKNQKNQKLSKIKKSKIIQKGQNKIIQKGQPFLTSFAIFHVFNDFLS